MDPADYGLDGEMVVMLRKLAPFASGVEGLREADISLADEADDRRMRTLVENGYVHAPTMKPRGDGRIAWSMHGVRLTEKARTFLRQLDESTAASGGDDARTLNVITIVGDVIGATIQQGTSRSSQRVDASITVEEHRQLEACLTTLRRARESGEIRLDHPDDEADLDAQMATIEHQLRSPRPNRRVLKTSFAIIGSLILNVAGNALWSYVPGWLGIA